MSALSPPNLEPDVAVDLSSGGLAPAGEVDTRFPGSPRFAPGGNQNDVWGSRNSDVSPGAGAQPGENRGNRAQVIVSPEHAAEIAPFLVELGVNLEAARRGRKHVFDDFMRGRLVSLLAMGLSIRQSAAALGLSHSAVRKELQRNPELKEQIDAARTQAQIEPLLVILRESKRSWRAATWVLSHLQKQMANHDETPDEKRARLREEAAEAREQAFRNQADTARRCSEEREAEERRRVEKAREENLALYGSRQQRSSQAKAAT